MHTEVKQYNFIYDKLNRLKDAAYSDGLSRDYSVGIQYDLNGNILTLDRKGRYANGTFGNIDNLTYSYKSGGQSNQLDRVDDVNATNNQAHGFTDLGAFAANEYNYDDNGNMLSDANRQITQITYNSMNLPVEITFSGGSGTTLTNTYLAGGTKLRKEKEGGKTDYIGSFIYEDDELKYIQTGGGRIVVNGTSYERQYYLTDHLGNVRLTFDTQGRVLQEDSYYPFGMAQEGLNYVNETLLDPEYKNKYLYNGKEQDGLTKFFEYGFRDYDAQLGRWHCIDPSAESYIASSPYHFVGNNPINNLELDGANFQQEFDDEARRYLESAKNSKGGGGVYKNPYFGFGGAYEGGYSNGSGFTSWDDVGDEINKLQQSSYGGISYGKGNTFYFASQEEAFLYGSLYNEHHDSWEHTEAGSIGKALNRFNRIMAGESLDENNQEWPTQAQMEIDYADVFKNQVLDLFQDQRQGLKPNPTDEETLAIMLQMAGAKLTTWGEGIDYYLKATHIRIIYENELGFDNNSTFSIYDLGTWDPIKPFVNNPGIFDLPSTPVDGGGKYIFMITYQPFRFEF